MHMNILYNTIMHEFTHCTRSYHVGRGIGGGLAWGGESRILAIREEKKSSAYAPATQYHYTVEKSSAAKVSADVVILPPPSQVEGYLYYFLLAAGTSCIIISVVYTIFCTRWLHVSIRIYP